ncbi:High affinity cAMP-specific and IBMX-insensitive 3',5'-cyclic phosphodiesterase 9A [Podila epigama]|nr:High affinity cAMP-specific and IBMX-insensitive 3',5'-cyclic phosphodiesterase 9A [Podila epigama]
MLRFVSGRSKAVNLDFNVWEHSMPEIYGVILGMFIKLGLVECLNITPGELLDFIIDVDRGYLATFYHSFYHAADVTAVLYHMLLDMKASQYLSKPDMAALLLAGLCHDIGHPGLNNLFQVNAKTELVKQHGETSVLEKYSCSLAMELVTKHSLFRNIEKSPEAMLPEGNQATDASMREAMVKAIMATDMSFHYDMLNNLNALIEFTSSPASSPNSSDGESESESGSESEVESESDSEMDKPSSPREPVHLHSKLCSHTHAHAQSQCHSSSTSTTLADNNNDNSARDSMRARFECPVSNHRRQSSIASTNSDCSQASDASDDSTQTLPSMDSRSPSDLTPELRQNLSNCLLHAADISNAIKPWALCKHWSDLVVHEFFRQGDIEKAQDLPVSPNMDRDQHNQPQISIGFCDFVVQPYFESFCEFLPEASPFLANLMSNRAQWQQLLAASQQAGTDANSSLDKTLHLGDDRRPSSPLPQHLGTGRRVSVAAGVLVLDDTRPQRVPHRRLRHSTNTEAHQSHMIRKIKRSLSGRSLSSCLHNLHSHPRSFQAIGKSVLSQEAIVSVLKREAAQAGKDAAVTSNLTSPASSTSSVENSNVTATTKVGPVAGVGGPGGGGPGGGGGSSAGGASLPKYSESETLWSRYRHRRHGSLQLENNHPSIRQEYGDGYVMLNDAERDFGRMWDHQRDGGNIPPTTVTTTTAITTATPPQHATLASNPSTAESKATEIATFTASPPAMASIAMGATTATATATATTTVPTSILTATPLDTMAGGGGRKKGNEVEGEGDQPALPVMSMFHSGQPRVSQTVPHPPNGHSGSRSSTPAVMMGSGRYGWGHEGLFGSKGGRVDRSGCGPLDNCVEDIPRPSSQVVVPTTTLATTESTGLHSNPNAAEPGKMKGSTMLIPTVVMSESGHDGEIGCVVGTTVPSPASSSLPMPPLSAQPKYETITISAATESSLGTQTR